MLFRDWPALGRKVSAVALGTVDFGTGCRRRRPLR
jgi:hypothetical protein